MKVPSCSACRTLTAILGAIVSSRLQPLALKTPAPAKQNKAGQYQNPSRDQSSLSTLRSRRRTNRACQPQTAKQDESSLFENYFAITFTELASKTPPYPKKHTISTKQIAKRNLPQIRTQMNGGVHQPTDYDQISGEDTGVCPLHISRTAIPLEPPFAPFVEALEDLIITEIVPVSIKISNGKPG